LAIVAESFRLVTARLIPRPCRYKQALLLALLILAGCGGSGAPKAGPASQIVRGAGFHFRAPASWAVKGSTASSGSQRVEVATFALVHAYADGLFTRVQRELDGRMAAVAKQTGGSVVAHRVVSASGIRSHSYDVRVGDHTDTYTFVLRGKREFQLLCSADKAVCHELVTSFGVS
jgi:hypothetical protein